MDHKTYGESDYFLIICISLATPFHLSDNVPPFLPCSQVLVMATIPCIYSFAHLPCLFLFYSSAPSPLLTAWRRVACKWFGLILCCLYLHNLFTHNLFLFPASHRMDQTKPKKGYYCCKTLTISYCNCCCSWLDTRRKWWECGLLVGYGSLPGGHHETLGLMLSLSKRQCDHHGGTSLLQEPSLGKGW
jgi:hypothetical protein